MMKIQSKKSSRTMKRALALVMSLALAMSTFAVSPSVDAASTKKPKLSVKKKTLYYNKAGKKSYTLKVKKTKKVKKITKTTWKTSKKSVVKISKKKKTSVKLTAKKAGKATITAKVKYTRKGSKKVNKVTLKCKVTSKKYNAGGTGTVTPTPTNGPGTVTPTPTNGIGTPTDTPAAATDTPAAATDTPAAATDTPAAATDTPAAATDTPAAATDTPAAATDTPAPAGPLTVDRVLSITKEGDDLFVTLAFAAGSEPTADALKDTTITLKNGNNTANAVFAELNDGKAIYKVDEAGKKVLSPGNTTANGSYTVSSSDAGLKFSEDAASSSVTYEESLAGNAIEGYVLTADNTGANKAPVEGAVVQVEGGQSARTRADGYYRVASVTGKKMLTVTKDGFVTKYLTGTNRVYVNKSHVTSQNIVLTKYDVNELGINITIKDAAAGTPVSGAKVELYDASGNKVDDSRGAGSVTEATGVITFGNNGYDYKIATDRTAVATGRNYLKQGTYTVKVSKYLSPSNVDEVYEEKEFTFTLADDYVNSATFEITKTAALKSFEVTQALKEKAEAAYITDTKMKATYTLYTKVHGNTLGTPIIAATAEVESGALTASKTAVTSILSGLKTTADVDALTLPTGDYYLVITPTVPVAAQANYSPAIGAYKVEITAGGDAKVTANLTEGNVRTINSQLTLPNAVAGTDVQKNTSEPSQLEAVKWDAVNKVYVDGTTLTGIGPWATTVIKATYTIKQVVEEGVEIQIGTEEVPYTVGTDGAYVASKMYNHFLGTGTYTITSVGDYSEKADPKTETIANDKGTVNFNNLSGAANPVEAVVKVVADSALIGVDADAAPKLRTVVAYDSTGAAVKTLDYTSNGAAGTGVAGAATASGAKLVLNDTIAYRIDTKKMNLPAGTYTFGITLEGYKEVTTGSVTVNAIEKVGLETEKKLERATADNNSISGHVKLINENGKGYQTLNNDTVKITNGTVVLLTQDKKIAAISTLEWNPGTADYTYSLIDKYKGYTVAAGTYKLVVRAQNTETYVKDVIVADGQQLTENVDLVPGALGQIKAFALDNNNKQLVGDYNAVPVAYDEYYVNPTNKDNYAVGKDNVNSTEFSAILALFATGSQGTFALGNGSFGLYKSISTGTGGSGYAYTENGVTMKGYYVYDKLPAGHYKVNVGANGYSDGSNYGGIDSWWQPPYQYKKEDVTIDDIGNIVKAEWTYVKTGETADTISVPLTIKLSSANAGLASNIEPAANKPIVAVIEAVKGEGAGSKMTIIALKNSSDAGHELKAIQVTGKTEYKVTIYTYEGTQVASGTINTERAAATIEIAVNGSEVD